MVRRRLVVSGGVQGVWFRESCRQEAARLGVTGWVRNRPDGRVEIEAEGEADAVAALEAWANEGPPLAQVVRVVADDIDVQRAERFEVR
jgi:acylphosphatase